MKILLACFLVVSITNVAHAQSSDERAGVERAVLDYVEGFYEGDTLKLKRSILPAVNKYGFYQPRGKTEYAGEPMSFQEMIDYALKVKQSNKPAPSSSPKEVQVFDVLDQTACAKLTAWWGTDYLLLGKYNGKWMIVQVLWQSVPRKN